MKAIRSALGALFATSIAFGGLAAPAHAQAPDHVQASAHAQAPAYAPARMQARVDECGGTFTGPRMVNNRLEWYASYSCSEYPGRSIPTLKLVVWLQKQGVQNGVTKFINIRGPKQDGPRVTLKVVEGAETWCDTNTRKQYRMYVEVHKDGVRVAATHSDASWHSCNII